MESTAFAIGTIIFVAAFVLFEYFQSATKTKDSLPCKWRMPILGNLHLLLLCRKPMPQFFAELSRELGPVFAFWFGWSQIVIVNDYDALVEMLNSDNFNDRPRRYSGKIISRNFSGIVMSDYNAEFIKRKGFCMQALRDKTKMEVPIQSECNLLLHSLRRDYEVCAGKKISLDDHVALAAVNVVWRFLFAQRFESVEDPDFKRVSRMEHLMLKGLVMANLTQSFPFLTYLPISFVKNLEEFASIRDDIVLSKMQQHLSSYHERSEPRDFTDLLLASYKTNPLGLSKDNLEMMIVDIYLTGFETARQACSWLFLFLVLCPEAQRKCHDEIDQILSKSEPSFESLHDMPYLRATISETLRKANVAPLAAPHRSREDSNLANVFIPKGTTILPNTYSSHFDEKYFPEPHVFRPERFLNENGTYITTKKGFLPFSDGPRKCLGQSMVWKEIFCISVTVLQHFHLRCPPGETLTDDGTFEFVFKPRKYQIVLEKRF